jgi:hypothetical protein
MAVNDIVMGAAGASGPGPYIEDLFSTYLYTGNSPTGQTINNGIDLSTYGGMVWIKSRSSAAHHTTWSTNLGLTRYIQPNTTAFRTATDTGRGVYAFNNNGFSLGPNLSGENDTNQATVSWTFRKQEKFFDIVTYTGNGGVLVVNHNLQSTPGCIIVKRLNLAYNWAVWNNSLGSSGKYLNLNNGNGFTSDVAFSAVDSSSFTVTENGTPLVNGNGSTYIAYIFASDTTGFGESGTDSVIKCGTYTGNGSATGPVVNLGWEPQWLLVKNVSALDDWVIFDSTRGITTGGNDYNLRINVNAEEQADNFISLTATGFSVNSTSTKVNGNTYKYSYIAIRRPMKKPTDGTQVFTQKVYTGTNVDNRLVNAGQFTDMVWARQRNSTTVAGMVVGDRLRGNNYLLTGSTAVENADANSLMTPTFLSAVSYGNAFSAMTGFGVGNDATSQLNASTTASNQVAECFKRAPGFFDVVCYTGDGAGGRVINHNLGVAPELMIVKRRSSPAENWIVYSANVGAGYEIRLNQTGAAALDATVWNNTSPTSSVFTVGTNSSTNGSTYTYVSYLFATVANVSKVGSYTGTGATQTINAGLASGARFVMIKRTDSTGAWFVWDTARGMDAGTDPRLAMNSTAAESNANWVYTVSTGFQIVTTDASVNASGGTYIYLAIA